MPERVLRGRLVFRQAGPALPLHHMAIALRPHRAIVAADWVRTTTDLDGRFSVTLDGASRLELRVFDVDHRYDAEGQPDDREILVLEETLDAAGDDLGDVPIGFWPYRDDTPVARAGSVDGKLPQAYSKGFLHTLELAFARTLPAKTVLEGMRLLGPERPTAHEIQELQPTVKSLVADREAPGTSRSDAWLADMLLNGFHVALDLGRDASDPRLLRASIRWGDMAARTDGAGFDLTDCDVTLDPRPDGVVPVRIALRIRTPGDGAWVSDRRLVSVPGDPDWDAAKRVVRCQYLLQGALDGHIITAHFQTEAAACAVFRNLRRSPIRRLLHAHLQEIVPQGHDGDSFAWGPNGILMAQSALTYAAVQERMARLTAGMCWSTFAPTPEVHPSHRWAQASARYWALLGRYLTAFFDANHEAIVDEWAEIRRFSDDLVRSSPPYDPLPPDPNVLPLREDPAVDRPVVDGVVRSVPAVTTSDVPAPGDLERLFQLCRTILFRATFEHTWTHDGQYDAGGDLLLATFGLRHGSLGRDDDAAVLPPSAILLSGISVNSLGMHANFGMILADEDHDVPPALKSVLAEEGPALSALGVDPARIRSRINI